MAVAKKGSLPPWLQDAAARKVAKMKKHGKKKAMPNAKAPLGQGGRFAALENKLSHQKGVTNPAALAAAIGRRKYGNAKFNAMSASGKK